MNKITPLLLVLFAVILSSCSAQPRKVNSEAAVVSAEAEEVTGPSREAVFVYNNTENLPSKLILALSSEPILLPSGYARLVGVVSGGKKTACFEIGGRGLALGEGEEIDDYRIVGIYGSHVVLKKYVSR